MDNKIKIFKYNGELIQQILFSDTALYHVEWLKGVDKYFDRPSTPKKADALGGQPLKPKKLMNLIREEDTGIINKEEGPKDITAEDIQAVNVVLKVGIEEKKRQREKQVENIGKKDGDVKPRRLENRWAARLQPAQNTAEPPTLLQRRKVSYEGQTGSKERAKPDLNQKKGDNFLDVVKEGGTDKKLRPVSGKSGDKSEKSKKSKRTKKPKEDGQKGEAGQKAEAGKNVTAGGKPVPVQKPEQAGDAAKKEQKPKIPKEKKERIHKISGENLGAETNTEGNAEKKSAKRQKKKPKAEELPDLLPINVGDLELGAIPNSNLNLNVEGNTQESPNKPPTSNKSPKKKKEKKTGTNKPVNVEEFFKEHQIDQLAGMLTSNQDPALQGAQILNMMFPPEEPAQPKTALPPPQSKLDSAQIMNMMFPPVEQVKAAPAEPK